MSRRVGRAATDRDGFSLVELVLVVILIGILAAIAIPIFSGQRDKAFDASIQSDLRTAAHEMESRATDGDSYVTSGVSIVESPGNRIEASTSLDNKGYCVRGSSPTSDALGETSGYYYYDSKQGGLQGAPTTSPPIGGACADLGASPTWAPL